MNARTLNLLGLGVVGVTGIAFLVLVPRLFELDVVLELTVYMIMAILALSLALIWGYGGILCFGQSAFFGLGAYTYAIAMFNIGESTIPLLLAVIVPAAFSASASPPSSASGPTPTRSRYSTSAKVRSRWFWRSSCRPPLRRCSAISCSTAGSATSISVSSR